MNGVCATLSDFFWSAVAAILGCAWTLGVHLGKSCGLLDDHEKAPVIRGRGHEPPSILGVTSTFPDALGISEVSRASDLFQQR